MGQFLGENIPYLVKDSSTQISLPATYLGQPTRLLLGGQGYKLNSALVCNLSSGGLDTGSLAANTLYYVYAAVSGGNVILEASLNGPSVGPTGFTQWRQIGRFRTLSGSAAVADVVNNYSGNGLRDETQMITEWQTSWTPTIAGGAVRGSGYTEKALWRRVGSNMEIVYDYYHAVAGTAGSGNYTWSLPSGYATDFSKINGTNGYIGTAEVVSGSSYLGYVRPGYIGPSNTNFEIVLQNTFGGGALMGSGIASFGAATVVINVRASIPITEWANLFS